MPWSRPSWLRAAGVTAAVLVAGWGAFLAGQQPAPVTVEPPAAPAPVSASAQRIYGEASRYLLQVRTLLKGQDSQASVGSGFLVTDEGHILTNYHVVSEAALQPERYRLVYSTADRREGPLQLLGFDAIHDLAIVKPVDPAPLAGHGALRFRPRDQPLAQGERIYSLGNPLDVGFAVIEGTYNGLVERSFYPTIFFAGSLNPGVSGGPTLDGQGAVIGVNVAARRDGEQVSFLVPAGVRRGSAAAGARRRADHRSGLSGPGQAAVDAPGGADRAASSQQPWRQAGHPRYVIPLPQETFMRCWGRSTPADAKGLEFEHAECEMDTRVFVSRLAHHRIAQRPARGLRRRQLGTLRFAQRYSASFANERFGGAGDPARTAPQCHERYVDREGLPLRAVICLSAYKKLTGLFDVSVLVATVDAPQQGVQGRFDAQGVSFDNALALAAHYLEGFRWIKAPTAR